MEVGTALKDKLCSLCSQLYFSERRDSLLSSTRHLNPNSRFEEEFAIISQINEALLALEDEITIVSNLLADRYTKRFPEMGSLNLSKLDYAKTVLTIGDTADLTRVNYSTILPPTMVLAMAMPASTTLGRPLSPESLADVVMLAETVVGMFELKRKFLEFLEGRMAKIAPNVTAIVGTTIASQLLGSTGSVSALAKTPAGNIMVIGRQRKELAGFSLGQSNPHAGYIFSSDLVTNTPPQYRTQAQRLIANKIALASRLDCQRQSIDGEYGRTLRQEIITKLEKLIEPAPINRAKPIPPPPIESSKKRGGRRARKQKELYAQTKVRKLANRMEFGKAEEEIIVGSNVVGLGELSAHSFGGGGGGLMRAPVLDNKLREHIKKQSQKAYAGFLLPAKSGVATGVTVNRETAISGAATSMTITPNEGIKLETKTTEGQNDATKSNKKYFGSNLSFRKS